MRKLYPPWSPHEFDDQWNSLKIEKWERIVDFHFAHVAFSFRWGYWIPVYVKGKRKRIPFRYSEVYPVQIPAESAREIMLRERGCVGRVRPTRKVHELLYVGKDCPKPVSHGLTTKDGEVTS